MPSRSGERLSPETLGGAIKSTDVWRRMQADAPALSRHHASPRANFSLRQ
jgi:hypothetical protein